MSKRLGAVVVISRVCISVSFSCSRSACTNSPGASVEQPEKCVNAIPFGSKWRAGASWAVPALAVKVRRCHNCRCVLHFSSAEMWKILLLLGRLRPRRPVYAGTLLHVPHAILIFVQRVSEHFERACQHGFERGTTPSLRVNQGVPLTGIRTRTRLRFRYCQLSAQFRDALFHP